MVALDLTLLDQPFDVGEIEFRPGNVRQDDKAQEGFTALALAYISSRAVMDRLDYVVGKENWRDEYAPAPAGGVMCTLYIRIDGEWVGKSDVGENTDFEAIKGGFSDALKRAAVKWGIGRYLYNLPAIYHPVREREYKGKKSYTFIGTPKLPNTAKARLDDRRETRLNTNEQPAKPKGTHNQGDRPLTTMEALAVYINKLAAESGESDDYINQGQGANIGKELSMLFRNNDIRAFFIEHVFGILPDEEGRLSKYLTCRDFAALKQWKNLNEVSADVLQAEIDMIAAAYMAEMGE